MSMMAPAFLIRHSLATNTPCCNQNYEPHFLTETEGASHGSVRLDAAGADAGWREQAVTLTDLSAGAYRR